MPPEATELAGKIDSIYAFLLIVSALSVIILIGAMIYFVIKYKRNSPDQKSAYITHNTTAEFLWSFIPFCIFMFVFAWGWIVYHEMRNFPEDSLEVHVLAKKWEWKFIYKNGREVTNTLNDQNEKEPAMMVVPQGRNVKLIMASTQINPGSKSETDRPVIHSFYVPAFRQKQDVVPGRYTSIWFKADKLGTFNLFCAEYCGGGHSGMHGLIKVVTPAEFDTWLSGEAAGASPGAGKPVSLASKGKEIYSTRACIGCHSLDGSAMTGPTWKGLYNSMVPLADGSTVKSDDNYIRESILAPQAKIVKGFGPPSAMPTYAGQLSDEDITAVIEFIKTIK
jgi:cytochrome c oxidase subunit 2